ncbi:hypothetical protein O9992_23715 [Vibrio lentus]|nr:hypothetical protein [Vibrio lentus]
MSSYAPTINVPINKRSFSGEVESWSVGSAQWEAFLSTDCLMNGSNTILVECLTYFENFVGVWMGRDSTMYLEVDLRKGVSG